MWGSASRPGRSLPLGKTRYPLYRRLGGPQGQSGQVRQISPPTGIRSPDHPARSQSLYRMSYVAHGIRRIIWRMVFVGETWCHLLKITNISEECVSNCCWNYVHKGVFRVNITAATGIRKFQNGKCGVIGSRFSYHISYTLAVIILVTKTACLLGKLSCKNHHQRKLLTAGLGWMRRQNTLTLDWNQVWNSVTARKCTRKYFTWWASLISCGWFT